MNFPSYLYQRFTLETATLALFLFSFPFSLRKVLLIYPPGTPFNEYTDISLYLSDIFLILFLAVTIIRNRSSILSSMQEKMFHVEHIVFAFLLLWFLSTIFWSPVPPLVLYTWIKFLGGVLLLGALVLQWKKDQMFHVEHFQTQCSTWNMKEVFLWCMVASGTIHAVFGLLQFFLQHSLGFTFLQEPILMTSLPGVAEVIIAGEPVLRAYGFFPHPNVFGGYLGVTLLITLFYPLLCKSKMFQVEHWRTRYCVLFLGALQFLALLSTFSKSALLGIVLALGYIRMKMFHVEHQSLSNRKKRQKMFHVEHFLLILSTILLITLLFQGISLYYYLFQPLSERLHLLVPLFSLSWNHWLFGLGLGQYVLSLNELGFSHLPQWQLQPIHNVPLLLLTEIGLSGISLVLLSIFMLKRIFMMFHVEQIMTNVPRGTFGKALLLFCLPPLLLDHYFWDIQQGMYLFWIVLALYYWRLDKN